MKVFDKRFEKINLEEEKGTPPQDPSEFAPDIPAYEDKL